MNTKYGNKLFIMFQLCNVALLKMGREREVHAFVSFEYDIFLSVNDSVNT